ncbi:MAG: hypothetical protein GXP29_00360 [Planctomycetes bacterium]|nr:hypothetical protein [Planctomycetota bacterium]
MDGVSEPAADPEKVARPWIGVRFECCDVYVRVYRDPSGTVYEGRCPRCMQVVRARVGPEGTSSRFFTAG